MILYQSLYNRLKNQHEAIENIIADTDKAHLVFHPSPNKWSIHDNIVHLAKYQPIFIERINMIIESDLPIFERYKAEDDPEFETWRQRAIPSLIKTLNTDRQLIFNLITNLPDEKLKRCGVHKKFGKLTVIQWTEFFLLHEAHHIFTIFQLANDVEVG